MDYTLVTLTYIDGSTETFKSTSYEFSDNYIEIKTLDESTITIFFDVIKKVEER